MSAEDIKKLEEQNKLLQKHYKELEKENSKLKEELQEEKESFKQFKQLINTVFQNKWDESKGEPMWLMNNMAFARFAYSLGIDLK